MPDLKKAKKSGRKLAMASIPDYPLAVWAARIRLDILGIGDSMGVVTFGFSNTLPVTVDMLIQHYRAVRRRAPNTFNLVTNALRQ